MQGVEKKMFTRYSAKPSQVELLICGKVANDITRQATSE